MRKRQRKPDCQFELFNLHLQIIEFTEELEAVKKYVIAKQLD